MGSTVDLNRMIQGLMSEIWAKKSIDSTMVGACHVFTAGARAAARKLGEEVSDCAAAMLFYDYMVSLGYSKRDIYAVSGSETLLPPAEPRGAAEDAYILGLAQQIRDIYERGRNDGGVTYAYEGDYDPFKDEEEREEN